MQLGGRHRRRPPATLSEATGFDSNDARPSDTSSARTLSPRGFASAATVVSLPG